MSRNISWEWDNSRIKQAIKSNERIREIRGLLLKKKLEKKKRFNR